MVRIITCSLGMVLLLCGLLVPPASFGVTIDFESVPDLTGAGVVVDTQFQAQGVLFTNTVALTEGISLGDDFLPPKSGSTVVSDDMGPMILTFSVPFLDVGGFFTYAISLTLSAFDPSGSPIGLPVTSTFSDNTALSGNLPNEFLHITGVGPIGSLRIEGDPAGASFTLDNFSATAAVPEPSTILLLGGALAGLIGYRVRQSRRLTR